MRGVRALNGGNAMLKNGLSILAAIGLSLSGSPAWASAVVSAPSSAYAVVPTSEGRIVTLQGEIQPGDLKLFLDVVNSAKPDIIVLDSPGGRVDVALFIAVEISRRGLNTFVSGDRSCTSACTLMFLSGKTKYSLAGASMGLHSAAYLDGTPSEIGTFAMAQYLKAIGTPANLVERMETTAPGEMFYLTEADKKALNIVVL